MGLETHVRPPPKKNNNNTNIWEHAFKFGSGVPGADQTGEPFGLPRESQKTSDSLHSLCCQAAQPNVKAGRLVIDSLQEMNGRVLVATLAPWTIFLRTNEPFVQTSVALPFFGLIFSGTG